MDYSNTKKIRNQESIELHCPARPHWYQTIYNQLKQNLGFETWECLN